MKKAILCFPYLPSRQIQCPTGLYKIASYCSDQYDIIVLDQRFQRNIGETISGLLSSGEILCLGLSVLTGNQILSAIEISKKFHDYVKIAWGGMHPTILPNETVKNKYVDYVIRGEGEEAFLHLLQYLDRKTTDTSFFLSKENHNYEYNYISDVNDVVIDLEKYHIDERYIIKRDGFERAINIETSRGCPHNCYYCHNSVYKTPYRYYSPNTTFQIIDTLVDKYSIDGIIFQEDNMFASLKRVRNFISAFLSREDIGWKANSRIDYFANYIKHDSFLTKLVQSGCRVLQFGIESGSERIQKFINKNLNLMDVIEVNKLLSRFPIKIRYNFIVGFPSETMDEINMTLDLIERLQDENPNMEPPFLNIYTPYPGTPLYDEALLYGFNQPKDTAEWIDVTWNKVSTPWLSPDLIHFLESKSNDFFQESLYLQ